MCQKLPQLLKDDAKRVIQKRKSLPSADAQAYTPNLLKR